MKRFFSWTVTDGKNQRFIGSLVSLTNADVLRQPRLPRNGHRIPILFLGSYSTEEEERVLIRSGAIELPEICQQKEIAAAGSVTARVRLKMTLEEMI